MTADFPQAFPSTYAAIEKATLASNFDMASDSLTGSLLRTLAASKPGGNFLELGTGTGLSTCWILDGMDLDSHLISIDHDQALLKVAADHLAQDERLDLVCMDGAQWIQSNPQLKFDFVFADTWPGKYLLLDEVLSMINKGGMYIVDDMAPQSNWPEGHQEKASRLIQTLEAREDFVVTKQRWATGMVIAVKK
ncbi:MAG TPA: class I SAM-dependent methyltransferase [Cyclobacteriaceae bacterium]|nr:class I SAM-dependent methyltransferase [Cyclobacteriaceae bacterium]